VYGAQRNTGEAKREAGPEDGSFILMQFFLPTLSLFSISFPWRPAGWHCSP
jgi:hypothetical protein